MKLNPIQRTTQWATATLLVMAGVLLVSSDHGDFVLWLNDRHSAFGDFFFKYWTYVGDGVTLGLFALYFLLTSYYRFNVMAIAIVLQTVFVHVFKQWLAAGEPRPQRYFEEIIEQLNFVDGVAVRSFDSFPSGHTASAFTLCFFLMLMTKKASAQAMLLLAALLVAISRVYILQHFGRDVFFGAIFGILAVLIAQGVMKRYEDSPKLQRGLLKP